MTNPFNLDSDALLNIATGVVLPQDVAQTLIHSTEKGRQQMKAFSSSVLIAMPLVSGNQYPT